MKSVEVAGEGRNNLFDYVTMDVRQPVGNRHAAELLWGSLAETYAEGGCEIHVHFRAGFVNGGVAGDWCAIFNRTEDWLDFVRSETMNPESHRNCSKERDVRQTVLVLDGKLVELPEGIVSVPVPSIVRLQSLDNCLGGWVDAPKHAIQFFQAIVATRPEDGKLGVPLDTFGHAPALVRQGQFKNEVIEGVTEVLETIADGEAKFVGGQRLQELDPEGILRAIAIEFFPSSVRVSFVPSSQFRIKALQVVDRPV